AVGRPFYPGLVIAGSMADPGNDRGVRSIANSGMQPSQKGLRGGASRRQQHQGQRDLASDQQSMQALRTYHASNRASAGLHDLTYFGPAELKGRREPEHQPGQQCQSNTET